MIRIEVELSGPLFDSRYDEAMRDLMDDAVTQVAAQGRANVMTILNARIQNPTPYYETQITVDASIPDRVVHDRDVIYGPWLEGVGSRNYPVTSFKGYSAFRKSSQALQRQANPLVRQVVQRHLPRLGG